jgi:hypothetical protein
MSEFIDRLEELRKKHPGSLTDADREFLNARRSYLHDHEKVELGIADEAEQEAVSEPATESKSVQRRKASQSKAEQE